MQSQHLTALLVLQASMLSRREQGNRDFYLLELELGPLAAAAFSRNGGTYAGTVAWRLGGVGRSTDTSESLMGSGRSPGLGGAREGDGLLLRAGGVGFRRERGRGPTRLCTVWRKKNYHRKINIVALLLKDFFLLSSFLKKITQQITCCHVTSITTSL